MRNLPRGHLPHAKFPPPPLYVKFSALSTTTAQTATSNLSPGGTINGQAFTGQETITIDAVGPTTLQSTVATLATDEDIGTLGLVTSADLHTMTAQTAANLSPGGTIYGQPFTGSETITAHSLAPQVPHLFGDAYNGDAARVWSFNAKENAEASTVPGRTTDGDIRATKFIGDLQGQADSAGSALTLGGQNASLFVTHTQLETALEGVPTQEGVTLPVARPSPPQTGQMILSTAGLEVFDGAFWRTILPITTAWSVVMMRRRQQ